MAKQAVKKKSAVAKPAGTKTAAASIKPIKEAFGKAGLVKHLAEQAQVEAKQVKAVLAALEETVLGAVHRRGAGLFTLPGLFKITAVKVPARPARKGKNPFTGEEQVFAAKPASIKIKVRPLKKLKDAAQ